MNLRPPGYGPGELPNCSIPQKPLGAAHQRCASNVVGRDGFEPPCPVRDAALQAAAISLSATYPCSGRTRPRPAPARHGPSLFLKGDFLSPTLLHVRTVKELPEPQKPSGLGIAPEATSISLDSESVTSAQHPQTIQWNPAFLAGSAPDTHAMKPTCPSCSRAGRRAPTSPAYCRLRLVWVV